MSIGNLTLDEVYKVAQSLKEKETGSIGLPREIVVLQRGWVLVGLLHKDGSEFKLTNGSVVRNWGTTKGLGELAANGPTASTKLDSIPDTRFHEMTVVLRISCSDKWGK